ncbi:Protein RER1A [Striga hermonthica]|uniref:Protein RER1 n=1 Tax=Striga hermonthica TaxID=68872 RepID=A0A9N7N3G5_STRHE|nr:Protein RER1A [Striga hermonthica]
MGGGAGIGDDSTTTTTTSAVTQLSHAVWRRYQHLLDKSTPMVLHRWISLAAVAFVFALRIYLVQGFYIITYGLGIYILQLLIAFLSPQVDPEIQELTDGPALPTRGSDEFRPFVRRLPEFKFWHSLMKAFCIAFVLTFFSAFDVPVFWPILLFYWLVLFVSTMKRQIMHMVKYKYVPFTLGKQRYGKKAAPADESSTARP